VSIKKFIYLLMAGQVTCFLILALSFVISTNRLQSMTSRILSDSRSIEIAHRLENAVLGERREDLLWRETGNTAFNDNRKGFLTAAQQLVTQLGKIGGTGKNGHLEHSVKAFFDSYKQSATVVPPPAIESLSRITDELLMSIEAYRQQKREQMENTLLISDRLNNTIDNWSLGLIGIVFFTTILGSFLLVKRILLPTTSLSKAVQAFGQRRSEISLPVYRNDELGLLSHGFNEMVRNIARLEQEKSHFIATITHDLKNPLMLIGASARRLRQVNAVPEEHRQKLDRIIDQTNTIEDMIEEMLDAMRMEEGNFLLHCRELDLADLLDTVRAKMAPVIDSHRLLFEISLGCPICGDPRRLERAVINLISNAIKYSKAGTSITVRLVRQKDQALLSVKDEGVGIPENERIKLFQPFTRLSHTRQMAKGTGLGLYAVKKIIDGHGGTITVHSAQDRGTEFTIALPLKKADSAPEQS